MTCRLHARHVDAARLAILGVALSASAAWANDPFSAAPDVLGPEARAFASQTVTEAMKNAWEKTFSEDLVIPGTMALPSDLADRSTVFLFPVFSDGKGYHAGSGTIVEGSFEFSRVLTAEHVAPLTRRGDDGEILDLVSVLAFGADGKPLASLQPVLLGGGGKADPFNLMAEEVMGDVAVLQPQHFASETALREWNDRAAQVASVQPAELLALTTDAASKALNSGISGASVRDGNNQIIGVITHAFGTIPSTTIEMGGSAYMERLDGQLREGGDPFGQKTRLWAIDAAAREHPSENRKAGGLAVAAPIVQEEVLQFLGVGPITAVEKIGPFHAKATGFPDRELITTRLIASPMEAFPAPRNLDPDKAMAFGYKDEALVLTGPGS